MSEIPEEKIAYVMKELGEQSAEAEKLVYFDVKEGKDEKGGAPYYKTYLDQTTASMGALFEKTEWGKLTPWQKLCCYKISGSKGIDCDASLRSTVIYQLAFGYGDPMKVEVAPYPPQKPKTGLYCLESDAGILRGDTMNSYATTVREFLRTYGHSEACVKGFLKKAKNGKWGTLEQYNGDAHWEMCVLDHYDYFKGLLPQAAEMFFSLYHTVGNFISAPPGFQGRGGRPTCDYWDLALACIHHYYTGINYPLGWMIQADNIPVCHKWLNGFGQGEDGWDSFVERNFLQDFVNQTGKHYGLPKELWKGHFNGSVKPKEKTDFEQFFTNASTWIAARGLRIALAVKKALPAKGSEGAEGEVRQ